MKRISKSTKGCIMLSKRIDRKVIWMSQVREECPCEDLSFQGKIRQLKKKTKSFERHLVILNQSLIIKHGRILNSQISKSSLFAQST